MQPLIEFFGRLHPLVLHTPIGVLPAVALIELLSLHPDRAAALRTARTLLWWLLALSAVASAATGLVLSREGAYSGPLIDKHFYVGLTFAGLCVVAALVASLATSARAKFFRLGSLSVVGLIMIPAGHLGASITHGEDFLTAPFNRSAKPATGQPADDHSWYATEIAPMLEASCVSCHNESKSKGGLMLHTHAALMAGATEGAVVVPGDPDNSELLYRITLPDGHEFRMPPDGKVGFTGAQISRLKAWIAAGASSTQPPPNADALPSPPAANSPSGLSPSAAGDAPKPEWSKAALAAMQSLMGEGASVERRTAGDSALVISIPASVAAPKAAELLAPLASNVADLSCPLSSPDTGFLTLLRSMPRLERLDLRGSKPTPADLAPLSGHPALRTLNLAGARLASPGVLATLESIPNLASAFLWDTGLSKDATAALQSARPKLTIDLGQSMGESPVEQEPPPVMKNDAPPVK